MEELKQRLTRELTQNRFVKIKQSSIWNLPVHPLNVSFETMRQTKMDVLMKMLLTAFQSADFRETEELSDLLLVEPIFIESLVRKMVNAGLIEKGLDVFMVTEKGKDQLATELFIDHFEEMSVELLYSPCHKRLLPEKTDEKVENSFADYRFYDDFSDWEVEEIEQKVIRESLQAVLPESETPNVQTVISEVQSIAPLAPMIIPCLEFQLYDEDRDLFYARVWNPLLNEWDQTVEAQINERDRQKWREQYK